MNINKLFILLAAVSIIAGCSGRPKVVRTEVSKQIDLSGQWNDADSRMVADNMIQDSLSGAWMADFLRNHNRAPVVIAGTVMNKSSEHIDSGLFIRNLEYSLTKSGKVKFVSSKEYRKELREEKVDQQAGFTSIETKKPSTQETGADFILQGSINSVKDEIKGKYAILYQVTLEMVNITTNEKVWIGQKEIKKIVSRSRFSL